MHRVSVDLLCAVRDACTAKSRHILPVNIFHDQFWGLRVTFIGSTVTGLSLVKVRKKSLHEGSDSAPMQQVTKVWQLDLSDTQLTFAFAQRM